MYIHITHIHTYITHYIGRGRRTNSCILRRGAMLPYCHVTPHVYPRLYTSAKNVTSFVYFNEGPCVNTAKGSSGE